MYDPCFVTLPNANRIPEGDNLAFPTVSAGSQMDPSQANAMISTEGLGTCWAVPPHAWELATMSNVYQFSRSSQDTLELQSTTTSFPSVAAPTCGLAGGLYCTLPLQGPASSIRSHLHLHGHRHPQLQTVECPVVGCPSALLWTSIPRHIQSVHLGIRFKCPNCDKAYTRPKGLAKHTASLKCYGAVHGGYKAGRIQPERHGRF